MSIYGWIWFGIFGAPIGVLGVVEAATTGRLVWLATLLVTVCMYGVARRMFWSQWPWRPWS